jgi:3-dehydroquinate synthase
MADKELKLKTSWKAQVTKIHFGIHHALSTRLPELIEESERKVVIITDEHIEKLYKRDLEVLDVGIFSFPPGENFKTRETKAMLEDHLFTHNYGRDSIIVGIGGGVVNDVAGFLASTYCRGVPLIQIPTSLLAMVDASIGGKTGVNTPYGKNLVGTFYPPQEVWIDGRFLTTLPERQKINGIVEIIKASLIASPSLFEELFEQVDQWQANALDLLMDLIFESVEIKLDIVERDPEEEKGIRRQLNLGHTFGHALEVLEGYQMEHGEAIAIGTLVSCYISQKMGYLDQTSFERIQEIFKLYNVPLRIQKMHNFDDMMATLIRDKKSLKSSPRVVLLEQIGEVATFDGEYCTEVDFPLLEEAIDWMYERFYHPPQ